ncbi:hypothetical protein, conserved [Trypanosoma brucei gambiense DAL972]|uniref:Uncharacterized protein n=1 Tax=Trypanosoma brucei gambiense (strain MHOM/CI/86/DAL972) TaxID=679716 RepID=C9ZLL7_TRYB9|nr:hypothetical protein, conserved [Trypanosoma brucei gambiense DAL972]CBH10226.1 hypothetical protein, conserved [Trypanosoma brucei gambiense DAL972]|eukprot:XP_011772516.1 hypothetical protein, conserved [Trypanosoma brucei gambiense DAL972]
MSSLPYRAEGGREGSTNSALQRATDACGDGDVEGRGSMTSVLRAPTVRLEMSYGEFIRACTRGYCFDCSWNIAPPTVPNAPILYNLLPMVEFLKSTEPLGVMGAELDAMAIGVLNSIPLSYHLLRPQVVEEARQLSMESERRVEKAKQRAIAEGLSDQTTWSPGSVNENLDPKDAELLDTDIDVSMMLERDKPSLTHLQRPLYTDMGLVSPEQRHLERISRIVPDELRSIVSLPLSLMSQTQPGGPPPHGGYLLSSASLACAARGSGETSENTAVQWKDGVIASFKAARSLDVSHEKMLKAIARTKLGLGGENCRTLAFVQRLWKLLFEGTNERQQCGMWSCLCHFSANYGSHDESEEVLEHAVEALELPDRGLWCSVTREYVKLLREYTASLPGGVEERRAALQISESELNPPKGGAFGADISVDNRLRRERGELGPNRQPVPIYPVEVVPLYPAGFQEYAEVYGTSGNEAANEVKLGEVETALHHVVLPGAVVGPESRSGGPHVLVANSNLLVADKQSDLQAADGVTLTYHASRENTFERLVLDANNTSSYLFQLCSVPETGGDVPTGLASAAGHYAVYRRLALRDLYVKAPDAKDPPLERYVVVFGEKENPRTESRKRGREDLGAGEDSAFYGTEGGGIC